MGKVSEKHKQIADLVLNNVSYEKAYAQVYPKSVKWEPKIRENHVRDILKREEIKEYMDSMKSMIREKMSERIAEKSLWTREMAIDKLNFVIECALEDVENKRKWNEEHRCDDNYKYMPVMPTSASKPITDAIEMLNNMHGFGESQKETNEKIQLTNLFIRETKFDDDPDVFTAPPISDMSVDKDKKDGDK